MTPPHTPEPRAVPITQRDIDAAKPFQGPLETWWSGKERMSDLLPAAFARHRAEDPLIGELVEGLDVLAATDFSQSTGDPKVFTRWVEGYRAGIQDARALLTRIEQERSA